MNHWLKGILLIVAVFAISIGVSIILSVEGEADKYEDRIVSVVIWCFGLISARYFIWYKNFED